MMLLGVIANSGTVQGAAVGEIDYSGYVAYTPPSSGNIDYSAEVAYTPQGFEDLE